MKKTFTVLIVDDERLARVRLKKLITKFSELLTIIGEAENAYEAERVIVDLQPDIVFLDIEMPGLTGFELLKKMNYPDPRVRGIKTT